MDTVTVFSVILALYYLGKGIVWAVGSVSGKADEVAARKLSRRLAYRNRY